MTSKQSTQTQCKHTEHARANSRALTSLGEHLSRRSSAHFSGHPSMDSQVVRAVVFDAAVLFRVDGSGSVLLVPDAHRFLLRMREFFLRTVATTRFPERRLCLRRLEYWGPYE